MGFDDENNDRLSEILKKEYFNPDTILMKPMEDKNIK